MLKGIVFDAYGTLFDVFSVEQRCNELFPGKGEAISQIWRQKQLEYTWLRTMMKQYRPFWEITREALCYALDSLELAYNETEIESCMEAYDNLTVFSDVPEALNKMSSNKLVILTNGNEEMLDQLLVNTGINQYLDGFLSADNIKLYKPRPEVYQLALKFLGFQKREILFVSSNAWDVAGAKSFGYFTAWINRSQKPCEHMEFEPDLVVSSLSELAQKLDKENLL